MNSEHIAQMIRSHRKQNGLTQAELAQKAQLGKTVVFDIEKGKTTVRLDTLLKILDTLGITLEFKEPIIDKIDKQPSGPEKWAIPAKAVKKAQKSGWLSKMFGRKK